MWSASRSAISGTHLCPLTSRPCRRDEPVRHHRDLAWDRCSAEAFSSGGSRASQARCRIHSELRPAATSGDVLLAPARRRPLARTTPAARRPRCDGPPGRPGISRSTGRSGIEAIHTAVLAAEEAQPLLDGRRTSTRQPVRCRQRSLPVAESKAHTPALPRRRRKPCLPPL